MTQDQATDEAAAALTIEVVTLFPDVMAGFLSATVIGRAIEAGVLAVHCTNPRDFAPGRHRQVDDTPYGGGPGMILSVEPIAAALEAIAAARGPSRRILLTPRGALFEQTRARALAAETHLTLICGRYEGIDERVTTLVDEELRLGDFVLAGGEVAAAAIIEAVARLVPGVLGCALSSSDESFSAGRLEYPQWTRPANWKGHSVPAVLLSGDHQAIARWRHREALKVTEARRPDLIATHPLSDEERRLLAVSLEVSSDKDT
jgi:tRNA (guanine37-N1)-methyltransferase